MPVTSVRHSLMPGGHTMQCWFCSVRDADEAHALHLEMYGDVDAKKTSSETKIAYNVRHIDVPRCADCHSRHVIAFYALILAGAMALGLVAAILVAVFADLAGWVWGLWAGLAAGLLLGALAIRFLILKGINSVHQARTQYPDIVALLEKCYRFGRRPKGPIPESDQPCEPPDTQA